MVQPVTCCMPFMFLASWSRHGFSLPVQKLHVNCKSLCAHVVCCQLPLLLLSQRALPSFPGRGRVASKRVYFIRSTLGGWTRWLWFLAAWCVRDYPAVCAVTTSLHCWLVSCERCLGSGHSDFKWMLPFAGVAQVQVWVQGDSFLQPLAASCHCRLVQRLSGTGSPCWGAFFFWADPWHLCGCCTPRTADTVLRPPWLAVCEGNLIHSAGFLEPFIRILWNCLLTWNCTFLLGLLFLGTYQAITNTGVIRKHFLTLLFFVVFVFCFSFVPLCLQRAFFP